MGICIKERGVGVVCGQGQPSHLAPKISNAVADVIHGSKEAPGEAVADVMDPKDAPSEGGLLADFLWFRTSEEKNVVGIGQGTEII